MDILNKNYDINKLPSDGYLIFPLSMSRLAGGQSPEECYEMIKHFESKISAVGIDLVILYTNGLYYNNNESALEVRKRTNGQMLAHRNALYNLIVKEKKYITQAIHFLPWDYTILDAPRFSEFFQTLKKAGETDEEFKKLLQEGLADRKTDEANLNFLIEEIVVNHLIREQIVSFPKTLVKKDTFRLIVYPGPHFEADKYQYKKSLLPKNKDCINLYKSGHYDFSKKVLVDFNK
jgi:hypothetical protein